MLHLLMIAINLSKQKSKERRRVKSSLKIKESDYIFSDSIIKIINGYKKISFLTLDTYNKLALTLEHMTINSQQYALTFIIALNKVCPLEIKTWQADNGSENQKVFEKQL